MSVTRREGRRWLIASLAVSMLGAGLVGSAAPARASGFENDDASTTDPGHFLVEVAWTYARAAGETSGEAPLAEVYYGLAPRLEAHVIASLAYARPQSGHTAFGPGDTEFALKYRVVDYSETDWWPAVAIEPAIDLPTGSRRLKLGTGRAHAFFPIWLEKKLGDWALFGGAGFGLNPDAGKKNDWFEGFGVGKDVSEKLWLGAEIFHQSADEDGGLPTTGINAGGTLALADRVRLLFTVGRGVQNAERTNQFTSYLGLQLGF